MNNNRLLFYFEKIRISVKGCLYYTIRLEVLTVHFFAQTPFLFFYLFLVVFGLCAGRFSDKSTIPCFLGVLYLVSNSLLVWLVCSTPTTKKWVGELVGFDFLEKYAPRNGLVNFLILFFALWSVLGTELISMHYLISAKLEQFDAYSEMLKQAINDNDFDRMGYCQNKRFEIAESTQFTNGVINALHSTRPFQFLHSVFR